MANNEILDLINLDYELQNSLNKKHDEKISMNEKIEKEKQVISKQAWEEVEVRVKKAKTELDVTIKENKESGVKLSEEHLQKVEEFFEQNKTKWISEIVNRCLD